MTGPAREAPASPDAGPAPSLQTEGLGVTVSTRSGPAEILRDVSLSLDPGRVLAVVGESGCGKSTFASAVAGLLPRNASVTGRIQLAGDDVAGLSERRLRRYRGRVVGYVPQDHIGAFNPVMTVERHLMEGPMAHLGHDRARARRRAGELLEMVGLDGGDRILKAYPHQLSGGMRQRVMIAAAMSCGPRLLVADEPTTALDVTVQARILALLDDLCRAQGTGLMLISHDLSVVAQVADEVAVLYSGEVVEWGPTEVLLRRPRHPYTEALLRAVPDPQDLASRRRVLATIPGRPPDIRGRPPGCWFHPRCPHAGGDDDCAVAHPGLQAVAPGHWVRSFHPRPAVGATMTGPDTGDAYAAAPEPGDPLLTVRGVSKRYGRRGGRGRSSEHAALLDVSIEIGRGQTFGLIGGSGSGKSTLAQCILQLNAPYEGKIQFDGRPLEALSAAELRSMRKQIQVIFQDARNSLDERMMVRASIAEALQIHEGRRPDRLDQRVDEALAQVGLPEEIGRRYPRQCSGGELQRVCIARALILKPRLLICDEAVSSLDVSTRAQILNLLRDLQAAEGISMLFITHDFGSVTAMSDVIGVLHQGRLVECGPAATVLHDRSDAYTEELIAAVPRLTAPRAGAATGADRAPVPTAET